MPTLSLSHLSRPQKKTVSFEASTAPREKPTDSPALPPRDSVGSVIGEKIIDHLRAHSLAQVGFQLTEVAAAVLIAWVLIDPQTGLHAAHGIIAAGNYALPKMVGAFAAVRYRREAWQLAKRAWRKVSSQSPADEKLVFGIPAIELTDYIVRNRHFRREGANGVRATFGLNMDKFNALAGELESAGVLERGENNGRVLAAQWSRQALLDFFGQQDSRKLSSWFRIHTFQASDETKVRLDREEIEENHASEARPSEC